jgi:hypothetical protein
MINCQSSRMHFMKAQLERPSHPLQLRFMESTAKKLSVLTRRTESFSPSKHSSQPMCNSSNYPPSTHNLLPAPSPPVISILGLSSDSSAPSMSSQSASPNSPTSGPLPPNPLKSAQIVTSNASGGQLEVYSPTSRLTSSVLSPTTISTSNHIYHVLPLSPFATLGQPLIHTSHDLVLPPTSAFSSSTYPMFTTIDCTWQYILDRVVNPSPL